MQVLYCTKLLFRLILTLHQIRKITGHHVGILPSFENFLSHVLVMVWWNGYRNLVILQKKQISSSEWQKPIELLLRMPMIASIVMLIFQTELKRTKTTIVYQEPREKWIMDLVFKPFKSQNSLGSQNYFRALEIMSLTWFWKIRQILEKKKLNWKYFQNQLLFVLSNELLKNLKYPTVF